MGQMIELTASDGHKLQAYRADPEGKPKGGVVVIQEIFGVNKVMRDICDWWAGQGYIAVCPDIFWRQEPGIQLTDQSEAEWQRAFELYQGFDEAKGIEDIQATINTIRNEPPEVLRILG